LLNRRGFSSFVACRACGERVQCVNCSVTLTYHRRDRRMLCHYCNYAEKVPSVCPKCGSEYIQFLGAGSERVEDELHRTFPTARIARMDRDTVAGKRQFETILHGFRERNFDILVGTQMIAKGHDFQRVSLVGVLNADTALFSHDFRASERLFAQLMQVSGRAGRAGLPGEVLVQTRYPRHALYHALGRQDYVGFANSTLGERRDAHLPPFVYQALLRAEGRTLDAALAFLLQAAAALPGLPGADRVTVYDAVPMTIVKVANVHRAQLLLESASRAALQHALRAWQPELRALKGVHRWSLEVDPLDI